MTSFSTSDAGTATFNHNTTSREAWKTWRKAVIGRDPARPALALPSIYSAIEYMSAPQGLIILAHQDTSAGQVDGIHPVELSVDVSDSRNIIEPFGRGSSGYAVHYLNRRQQGGLVLGAYGKMIDAGDPQAPMFRAANGNLSVDVFNTRRGPVACVWQGDDQVHVIQRGLSAIQGGRAA